MTTPKSAVRLSSVPTSDQAPAPAESIVQNVEASQISYVLPENVQFSTESTQIQRIPFIYKNCKLTKTWYFNIPNQSSKNSISGEMRTLLKDDFKGKGSVFLTDIEVEMMSIESKGCVAIGFCSSDDDITSLDDIISLPNKQVWYFNSATRGILGRYRLHIPNSVSAQIIPSSADYPSLYMVAVATSDAKFYMNMRITYDCTKIINVSSF